MQVFLIRLLEINEDEAFKLASWAGPRCKEFKLILEEYQCMFAGVLRIPTDYKKFVKTMRCNTSNWGIGHIPNVKWIESISMATYIDVYGGFYEQRLKESQDLKDAVAAAVARDLYKIEEVRKLKLKALRDGQQRVNRVERAIAQSIFKSWAEPVIARKEQASRVLELFNTTKRARFRDELDKLGICTCLPFDCSGYDDLEDIVQIQEMVVYKRRKLLSQGARQ